jgi:hypothetical protein
MVGCTDKYKNGHMSLETQLIARLILSAQLYILVGVQSAPGRQNMSIVTTQQLRYLYSAANAPNAQETQTIDFWSYYLTNFVFQGPRYILSHQSPPAVDQGNRRRRIDFRICSFDMTVPELRAIVIVEGKGANTTAVAIEEVEAQAQQASQAYLQANRTISFVYSYTLVGTRASLEMWKSGVYLGLPTRKPQWQSRSGKLIMLMSFV